MNKQLNTHPLPSQEELINTFNYNPITGEMLNKVTGHTYKKTKYQRIELHGIKYLAHRIAWKIMTGLEPVGVIDHDNEDPSDNRWCNLQDITNAENLEKARDKKPVRGIYPPNYKGNRCRGWIARPTIAGVKHYLGVFPTKRAAMDAASALRRQTSA